MALGGRTFTNRKFLERRDGLQRKGGTLSWRGGRREKKDAGGSSSWYKKYNDG